MKNRILMLFVLLSGFLFVQEVQSFARFKSVFSRYASKRKPQMRQQKTRPFTQKTRKFQTFQSRLKTPFSKRAKAGAGLFGGVSLFAAIKNWWYGDEAKIAEKLGEERDFIPTPGQIAGRHEKRDENPQIQVLSYLGFKNYSSVVEDIAKKVDQKLSLETKKKLAEYFGAMRWTDDPENTLIGARSTHALTLLPLLVYVHKQQLEGYKDVVYDSVPVDLLPMSVKGVFAHHGQEFFPFLYTARRGKNSPVVNALDSGKTMSIEEFKAMVSSPIIQIMKIKKQKEFENDLLKLIDTNYEALKSQNELLVVKDQYFGQTSPNYNYVTRYYGGTTKAARVLTFHEKKLNENWGKVYFSAKDPENTKVLEDFISSKETGKPRKLKVIQSWFGKQPEIRVDTKAAIKENSIYDNEELLKDVMDLVEKYK